jgi:circadian clock protein KaiC
MAEQELSKTPTGIDGLDQMLGGGFPKGRVIIVSGGPGTGKTTMAIQFLVNGFSKSRDRGLFASLDEPVRRLFEEMTSLGWNIQDLQERGVVSFLDAPHLEMSEISGERVGHKTTKFSVEDLISASGMPDLKK